MWHPTHICVLEIFLHARQLWYFCVNIYNQFVEIIPKLFQFVESLLDAGQESFLLLICHSAICIVSVVNQCTFRRPNAKLIADCWSTTTSSVLKCEACFSCFRFNSCTLALLWRQVMMADASLRCRLTALVCSSITNEIVETKEFIVTFSSVSHFLLLYFTVDAFITKIRTSSHFLCHTASIMLIMSLRSSTPAWFGSIQEKHTERICTSTRGRLEDTNR
jgi:hypothetical protein